MSDNKPCIIYDSILQNRYNGIEIKIIYSLLNDINKLIELELFDNLGDLLCNDNLLNIFSNIYNLINSKNTNNNDILNKLFNGLKYMYDNQEQIHNAENMLEHYKLKDIIENLYKKDNNFYYVIAIFKLIKSMY